VILSLHMKCTVTTVNSKVSGHRQFRDNFDILIIQSYFLISNCCLKCDVGCRNLINWSVAYKMLHCTVSWASIRTNISFYTALLKLQLEAAILAKHAVITYI